MKGSNQEATFLLRRAEEETIRALTSDQPDAAAAHQGLAVLYTERACRELASLDTPDKESDPEPLQMPPQRA